MQDRKEELKDQIQQLKEVREMARMNRTQFAEYIEIPRRTLEEWEGGRRKAPEYILISTMSRYERQPFYDMLLV